MLSLEAPAKINWSLAVLGKRTDGFHEIRSLIQKVDLHDTLQFEDADEIELITSSPIETSENLVFKAALALREHLNISRGVRVKLIKHIPIAAGLGGGSSDAASALRGLCTLWNAEVPSGELASIAASIGSDVPFFLGPPASFAEGRGERLTPAAINRRSCLLLVKPNFEVSAAWAYGRVRQYSATVPDVVRMVDGLNQGDFPSIASSVINDLEGPVEAAHPAIGEIKGKLREEGALLSLMSGSGPTVFGVFRGRPEALRAAEKFPSCWTAVVETIT